MSILLRKYVFLLFGSLCTHTMEVMQKNDDTTISLQCHEHRFYLLYFFVWLQTLVTDSRDVTLRYKTIMKCDRESFVVHF